MWNALITYKEGDKIEKEVESRNTIHGVIKVANLYAWDATKEIISIDIYRGGK